MQGPGAALQPGLDGQRNPLMRPVFPYQFQGCGHGHSIEVSDRYIVSISGGLRSLDGEVKAPVVEEPSAPEPGQVFACLIVHRAEEIVWSGMAIGPAPNVLPECIVESPG